MSRLEVAIGPSLSSTRLLVKSPMGECLLKARLLSEPRHLRALETLLEGLALWQGAKAHAVVAVDEQVPLFKTHWHDLWLGVDTALYSLECAVTGGRRRRDELSGMGCFRDLHRVLAEVRR